MTDTIETPARALTAGVDAPERISLDGPAAGFHLRRLTLEDTEALHEAVVASYAELHPWMPWCTEPVEISGHRDFLERAARSWPEATAFNWGVFDDEGRYCGTISLMDRVGPGALEIGYWLRTDVTGRGVMTAAARALTSVGLAMPGIERVEIHCDAANLRSAAVPRRLGYHLARETAVKITAPGECGRHQVWVTP